MKEKEELQKCYFLNFQTENHKVNYCETVHIDNSTVSDVKHQIKQKVLLIFF